MSLKSKTSAPRNMKVLLLIDISRFAGSEFVSGITKYARLYGSWTFYTDIPFFGSPRHHRYDFSGYDGLIVFNPDTQIVNQAIAAGLPVIIKGLKGKIPGLPNFVSDNKAIGHLAMEHLLALGLKHFGFCGYKGFKWSQERGEYFAERLAEKGFKVDFCMLPNSKRKQSFFERESIISQYLKRLPKPAGIFSCNDDMNVQVAHACRLANLRVPDELAILGVDNEVNICELANPPLTSIGRNFVKAGYEALELLHQLILDRNADAHDIMIEPTRVIQRQSTDVLAVPDEYVAEAVRFIRTNSYRPISVSDILDVIPLSQRYLNEKFLKAFGHSIHKEIARCRVKRIREMLIETNLTISQIAYDLGFNSADHIGRYFRRYTGVNPSNYRRNHAFRGSEL